MVSARSVRGCPAPAWLSVQPPAPSSASSPVSRSRHTVTSVNISSSKGCITAPVLPVLWLRRSRDLGGVETHGCAPVSGFSLSVTSWGSPCHIRCHHCLSRSNVPPGTDHAYLVHRPSGDTGSLHLQLLDHYYSSHGVQHLPGFCSQFFGVKYPERNCWVMWSCLTSRSSHCCFPRQLHRARPSSSLTGQRCGRRPHTRLHTVVLWGFDSSRSWSPQVSLRFLFCISPED